MARRSVFAALANEEEAYADAFAYALLMPEKEVRRMYHDGAGWVRMMMRFGVTQEHMVKRMKDLGLEIRV